MLAKGLTVTEAPVKLPGFQVYVEAPLAVNVLTKPGQIAIGLANAVTDGILFTTRVKTELLEQALAVPTTV